MPRKLLDPAPMLPLPDFHAGALRLRPFLPGDESAWFTYLCLPEVARSTGWHIASSEELLPLTRKAESEPVMRFALADGENRLAGTIGFFDWEAGQAEIAYDLAPAWWGRGIASGACEALCRWAFGHGLQSVKASVLTENRASARVLEKCGFEWETMARQARHLDGVERNYRVYRLRERHHDVTTD